MPDVIALIEEDHREVEELFSQFETSDDTGKRAEIGERIIQELTIHAELEEAILYPAIKRALPDGKALIDHATKEHEQAESLIERLDGTDPDDPEVRQGFSELRSTVEEHVQEEEREVLPKFEAAASRDQLDKLGTQYDKAKQDALRVLRELGF